MKKPYGLIAGVLLSLSVMSASAATFKFALDADPVSLDPHEQLSGGTLQMSHWLFDPLVRWTQDYQFEPRLAERWEQIDDVTMRFHLRKDVKFHSGNLMTAKDVKWTLERLQASPDFKGIFGVFAGAKVVDDHTVDLMTKAPYGMFLNAATYLFPMDSAYYSGTDANGKDKAAVIKHGDSFASRNASGSGPFTVVAREQGVKIEFARNPAYWDKKSPGNVDKMVLTPIKEGPTRVAALLSGDVDYIAPVPPTDIERVRSDSKSSLITMSGTRIITLQMNQARRAEFKDPRVRQAFVYAINQEGIVDKIMKGFATPAAQLSPKGYLGHNPALKPRYDLKKAQQLMKEAGYEKGFSITMAAPNNRYVNDEKIAQAVAAMLAKINVKVDLKTMPKAQYWPEFDLRSADVMMIGWHSDTEDSNNFFEFLAACPDKDKGTGQYNSGNYCNPKVDAMVAQANTETDSAKRAQIMQGIEQILYDEAAFIPLHWQDLAWGAKKGVGAEAVINVMDFPYFGDLIIK
jgi:peptide/nickel transport system substrate-binding protein